MCCSISPAVTMSATRTPSPPQVSVSVTVCVVFVIHAHRYSCESSYVTDACVIITTVCVFFFLIPSGAVLALTCALMLLNTDLHGQVRHLRVKASD